MRRLRAAVLVVLGTAAGLGQGALAEDPGHAVLRSPVLTIDQERLFTDSRTGQALIAALEADTAELAAENRRIESELIAEERALTERRQTMSAEDFRPLAEAFDEKVVAIRRTQDSKARALAQRRETDKQRFFREALPLVAEIVRERGAVVVLERGAVILSAEQVDITDAAIALIDTRLGTDTGPPPAPDGITPE